MMKFLKTIIFCGILVSVCSCSTSNSSLSNIRNFQSNSPTMLSAGMPTDQQFVTLKKLGVTKVIDLIPGDRTDESSLMQRLNLEYHNIQVEWGSPTLENFKQYVVLMKHSPHGNEKILTHCRLNWRGAVFTYLYQVTQLNWPEPLARKEMLNIWQPNDTWQQFITLVMSEYNQSNALTRSL